MKFKLSKKVLTSGLLSATLLCSFVPMTPVVSGLSWQDAIVKGDLDELRSPRFDPNCIDNGITPLMYLVKIAPNLGDKETIRKVVDILVYRGACILKENVPCEMNAVEYAIKNGRYDIACHMLCTAIARRHIGVREIVRKNGDTPLHVAARANDKETIDFLISKGADVFSTNSAGESILSVAKKVQNEALIKEIVSAQVKKYGKFDINDVEHKKGDTPLHWLVRNKCDADVIEKAIANGGNIRAKNFVGESPLSIAIGLDDYDLLIRMLEKSGVRTGADGSILDKEIKDYIFTTASGCGARSIFMKLGGIRVRSMEILHRCRLLPHKDRKEFIKKHDDEFSDSVPIIGLIKKVCGKSVYLSDYFVPGQDFNVETRFLFTPLRSCLFNPWCAERLLQCGADIDYQDRYGYTALHHEIINGYGAAGVIWLLDHGARTDLEDYLGHTALYYLTHKEDGTKKDSDRIGDYVIKYCEKKGLTVPRD